jgi:Ni/Co efflux regulator RcnB
MNTQTFATITFLCAALAFPVSAQKGQDHGNQGKDRGGENRGNDNRGNDNRAGDNRGNDNRGNDNRGGDNRGATGQQHRQNSTAIFVVNDRDRSTVSSYYRAEFARGNCPPGLAKKDNGCLPPGQAKKIWVVDRPLPPAVVYYPLPTELYGRLTPPPAGYQYVRVDDDVLLMQTATRSVVNLVVSLR